MTTKRTKRTSPQCEERIVRPRPNRSAVVRRCQNAPVDGSRFCSSCLLRHIRVMKLRDHYATKAAGIRGKR